MKILIRARFIAAAIGRGVGRIVPPVMMNVLFFGGLGAISYGAWLFSRPLGFVIAGVCAIITAFLISAESK
jgi:hypothetical protein